MGDSAFSRHCAAYMCQEKESRRTRENSRRLGGWELLEEVIDLLPDWREGVEKWLMRTKLSRPLWSDQEGPVPRAGVLATLPSSASPLCYLPVCSWLHPSLPPGARSEGLLH